MNIPVIKAHAFGNDFLFAPAGSVPQRDEPRLARAMCHRHHGIGADGLIFYGLTAHGATMRLWNADGSASELSGNGLRCLGALVIRARRAGQVSADVDPRLVIVESAAGEKVLELLEAAGHRLTFRAAMGAPVGIRQAHIDVAGETLAATILTMGNPQCVVLGALPDEDRFARLGRALATHPMFPAGTNVEFAHVEAPDRVRILIWERGVGPTTSSGTGSCASAVAAAAHGGAARDVDVIAPGGTQRVEWHDDGVWLTGWAEVVMDGTWVGDAGAGPEHSP